MPIVNGHRADVGCYVEGHWGQYGPDHLADRAEEFGWESTGTNDPRHWRAAAEQTDEVDHPYWEHHSEAADEIEQWLNEHTPPICSECGHEMYATSDGFYRHRDFANGRTPCGTAATDSPLFFYWTWEDGEFYLLQREDDD